MFRNGLAIQCQVCEVQVEDEEAKVCEIFVELPKNVDQVEERVSQFKKIVCMDLPSGKPRPRDS